MHRWLLFFGLGVTALAQTATPDSQVLQALLTEIRQFRQDLQNTTLVTQRVQIVLYRLQGQEAAVTRATQRLDAARAKLGDTETQRKDFVTKIQHMEETQNTNLDPIEKKHNQEQLPQFKAWLENLIAEEQQRQMRVVEAESQLRAEQAKLSEQQDVLDKLDKALETLSRQQTSGGR
jgi:hypothetical protein